MSEAYIIDACRTPRGIGKAGKGSLSDVHPQRLTSTVLRTIALRNNLDTADIDDVIWGTCTQIGPQGGDLGRMAALDAGFDVKAGGVTLDRFCGSGLTAVNFAAGMVQSGYEDLIIAGGTEMMSFTNTLPFEQISAGHRGNTHLRNIHPQSNQGVCADAIASLEKIPRMDLDSFAVESQRRASIAMTQNRFSKSIVSVYTDDGKLLLDCDEYPRPDTSLEKLASLTPAFQDIADTISDSYDMTYRKIIQSKYPGLEFTGVHHAGNSSGMVDGSACVLIASKNYVRSRGLKPRAVIKAIANIGDCPTLMLNAPVPSAKKALNKAKLTPKDIDLWEINEAFAVVAEKFIRDLNLNRDKVNVNGGAIALGHPIGATGAILIGTILDELERQDLRRGLVTMCAAGGMAPSLIIERL